MACGTYQYRSSSKSAFALISYTLATMPPCPNKNVRIELAAHRFRGEYCPQHHGSELPDLTVTYLSILLRHLSLVLLKRFDSPRTRLLTSAQCVSDAPFHNSNDPFLIGISTLVPSRWAANLIIVASSPCTKNVRFAPVLLCQANNSA